MAGRARRRAGSSSCALAPHHLELQPREARTGVQYTPQLSPFRRARARLPESGLVAPHTLTSLNHHPPLARYDPHEHKCSL